jgi:hypothetical protein
VSLAILANLKTMPLLSNNKPIDGGVQISAERANHPLLNGDAV